MQLLEGAAAARVIQERLPPWPAAVAVSKRPAIMAAAAPLDGGRPGQQQQQQGQQPEEEEGREREAAQLLRHLNPQQVCRMLRAPRAQAQYTGGFDMTLGHMTTWPWVTRT